MAKSDLFKTAHKTAKENRSCFADYRMAFAWALKETYKMLKENPFETRFNDALKAAEADADATSVSDQNRGTYISFHMCDDLDCREIYSVSDLDCIRGKRKQSLLTHVHHSPDRKRRRRQKAPHSRHGNSRTPGRPLGRPGCQARRNAGHPPDAYRKIKNRLFKKFI